MSYPATNNLSISRYESEYTRIKNYPRILIKKRHFTRLIYLNSVFGQLLTQYLATVLGTN